MMPSDRRNPKGPLIGLDIGSFAVRAAEVSIDGPVRSLTRFGQVTLPPGAVVDGEVVDVDAVAEAVKRLWSSVGFSSKRVIVGVSSQRVIVRLAEVLEMSERELRSSLQFEAADLIPIPVEEAVLDSSILSSEETSSTTPEAPRMRILLAAAQRTMVGRHLAVLKKAGLEAIAVDPLALALLRGARFDDMHGSDDDADAVVSIGAALTTIAVQQGGVVRFVRVIGVGGSNLTNAVSAETGVDADMAEGIKRRAGPGDPAVVSAMGKSTPVAMSRHVAVLVDQVRGSIDFYGAQKGARQVGRIILTGGGAQVEGAFDGLRNALGPIVQYADPLAGLDTDSTGLSPEQLREAAPYLLAPIGLALWATTPGRSISLLPEDVLIRRRHRRQATRAALAVVVFAAVLGLASTSGTTKVNHAKQAANLEEASILPLQHQVASLSAVTATQSELASRAQLYKTAVQHNVDWVGLLEQLGVVMPAGSYLTGFTATSSASTLGAASSTTTVAVDGQVSLTVVAPGGLGAVADWLRALSVLPSLQNVVVASESAGSGTGPSSISFASTATVTSAAESDRGSHIPGSVA
jgi:type IV pilus assembly protein PilM